MMSDGKIRKFETGATRDANNNKLSYEGFFSPIVLQAFAEYMHKHRSMPDGSFREPDNWQKTYGENHYATCMDSLLRHVMDLWLEHRGFKSREGVEDALCGILFNTMAYYYKLLIDKHSTKKADCNEPETVTDEHKTSTCAYPTHYE